MTPEQIYDLAKAAGIILAILNGVYIVYLTRFTPR